jgi:hypothetical protein
MREIRLLRGRLPRKGGGLTGRWNSGPSTPSSISKKKKYNCKFQDEWIKSLLYDYIVRFGEKIKLFLNQFLRESRNKIICKLYEEETIFISAFNAENFMKIR